MRVFKKRTASTPAGRWSDGGAMIFAIKSLIYALAGVAGGMILTQTFFKGALALPKDLRFGLFGAAISVTALFFLAPSPLIFLVGSGAAITFFGQKADKAILGAFLLPLLPNTTMQFLSLPGINYLYPLNFPIIVSLFAFLPAMGRKGGERLGGYKTLDRLFLFMVISWIVLSFRSDSITHNLREASVTVLTFIVPYLAITRSINSREKFILLFKAILVSFVIMACVAFICQQFWWDIYSGQADRLFGGHSLTKMRGGLLRITSTYGNAYINVGILLVMGALFSVAFAPKTKGFITKYGLPVVLLFGALMTASRSPFIAGILSTPILLTAFPNVFGKVMRFVVIGAVSIGLIAVSPLGEGIADFMPSFDSDEEQSYRSRLMEVGMQEVRKRPLLGDPVYFDNPNFEVLRQGEGIVDFVNSYLEKALHYGVPLALIYILMAIGPGLLAWRASRKLGPDDLEWRFVGGAMAAGLVCFAAGLFGTATNGQTEIVQYVLLGMTVCYLRITLATSSAPVTSKRVYPGAMAQPIATTTS